MREVSVGQALAAKAKGRQARCGVGEKSMCKLFRACMKTPLAVGSRSVHVWQAGSAGEQLLAAHSVSASCWWCWMAHVGGMLERKPVVGGVAHVSELPGSKKDIN